jgi:protein-S-isoprenylcysteine O-methyltransferase Ste14
VRAPQLGPRGEGWVVAQFAVGGLVAALGAAELRRSPRPTTWRAIRIPMGLAVIGIGVVTAARGASDLGTSLTPMPRPLEDATLVETGIYARIRHPIYAGVAAVCFGWAILSGSRPAAALSVVEAAIFWAKAGVEEAWLRDRYAGYVAYARRTHRFIPGLV